MSKPLILAFSLLLPVAGCGQRDYSVAPQQAFATKIELPRDMAGPDSQQYLERQHFVTIDVAQDKIESSFNAAVAACNTDKALACVLLDSSLSKGEDSTANVSARVAPAGVEPFIALAAKEGAIESRSTRTNDLQQPISDNATKLSMLEAYMADLLRLRQQLKSDADSLIKVASEIAKTQTEIDALKGEKTQLSQRVDLQLVHFNFYSHRSQSVATPIGRALRDFGANLSGGVAEAITGLAHLLPWLIVLVPLIFLFRFLWRRFR